MDIVFGIIGTIFLLLIFFRFYISRKAKAGIGKPIKDEIINSKSFAKIRDKKGLIYFYTPTCPNCKTQKPVIDKLKKKSVNVVEVDLSQQRDLAFAFGIMGVPSTVVVNKNIIRDVMIGPRDESTLMEKYSSAV